MIKMRKAGKDEASEHIKNVVAVIFSQEKLTGKERLHFKDLWIEIFK